MDAIEITETWKVVDRWWTDEPLVRHWASLRSPSAIEDKRVAVCWDERSRTWTLRPEPDSEAIREPKGAA